MRSEQHGRRGHRARRATSWLKGLGLGGARASLPERPVTQRLWHHLHASRAPDHSGVAWSSARGAGSGRWDERRVVVPRSYSTLREAWAKLGFRERAASHTLPHRLHTDVTRRTLG